MVNASEPKSSKNTAKNVFEIVLKDLKYKTEGSSVDGNTSVYLCQ